MRGGRWAVAIVGAAASVALVLPAGGQPAEDPPTGPPDTLRVLDQSTTERPAVEVAVTLSAGTFPDGAATVVLARHDDFPDALASGVLQADAPLLLTPSTHLDPQVAAEIDRLGATTAILLGGTTALAPAVADQLDQAGLSVTRLHGPTRFETAVAVARHATPTDAVIIARGTGDPDDPTRAFADALAGGALAATRRWPLILTAPDTLPAPTLDHLSATQPDQIIVLGGPAAISDAVVDQLRTHAPTVRRLAGPTRFDTALAIAAELGATTVADSDAFTLTDATTPDAWVGGFTAAANAAARHAPLILATPDGVPTPTATWLSAGIGTQTTSDELIATCVIVYTTCEEARRLGDLPAAPLFTFSPPPGSAVPAGAPIMITVDPPEQAAGQELTVASACDGDTAETRTLTLDEAASARVAMPAGTNCFVASRTTLTTGIADQAFRTYIGAGTAPRPDGGLFVIHIPESSGEPPTGTPMVVDVTVECEDPGWSPHSLRLLGGAIDGPIGMVDNRVGTAYPAGPCRGEAAFPAEATAARWEIRAGGAVIRSGEGTVMEVDFSSVDEQIPGVEVVWIASVPANSTPPPLSNPPSVVRVFLQGDQNALSSITLSCDDGTSATGWNTHLVHVDVGASCEVVSSVADVRFVVLHGGHPVAIEGRRSFAADAAAGTVSIVALPPGYAG